MEDFDHAGFLKAWFPSLAGSSEYPAFFWAYNEFLCTTPGGKRSVLDDKLLLAGFLTASGLQTPRLFLAILGGRFILPSGEEVDEAAAARILEGQGAFFKTRTGWGGQNAFRLHPDGTIHSTDGSCVRKGLPRLLAEIRRSDYLVQELVRQDPRFAEAAPASVNTVRCMTFPGDPQEPVRVALMFWRIGNGTAIVDNASGGGMICAVDLETGRVFSPAADKSLTLYDTHPVTGFRFRGTEVPGFAAILQTVTRAHQTLNTSMSIAWDVAMTPEGPSILEGNGHWGLDFEDLIDPRFEQKLWRTFMQGRRIEGSGFPAEERRIRGTDMIRATLSIRGKVQGVGYRKWLSRYAAERGVEANPKNLGDGTVRCRLIGQRWRVEFVTLACHRGPAAAEVERVDVQEVRPVR